MPVDIPTLLTAAGHSPAFEISAPAEQRLPIVFCSPHSGRAYPCEFLTETRLGPDAVRRSEDLFVDQLFDFAPALGAPLIAARFPRAFLDVNREPYELDPAMFEGELPIGVNSASVRVAGGLGTIPRIVAEREEIYRRKLPLSEIEARVDRLYFPFHEALEQLLNETRSRFGFAILLDCHSMPSTVRTQVGGRRADIVLGDRFGVSAAQNFVIAATQHLQGLGFEVSRNKPYAGGFITERYGAPREGVHAIQIEINRGLYADEANFLPHSGFADMRARLWRFVTGFAAQVDADLQRPLAAE